MQLKLSHHVLTGRRICEVYDNDGTFVAAIYPNNDRNGIKIVSKYLGKCDLDDGKASAPPFPAILIDFKSAENQSS